MLGWILVCGSCSRGAESPQLTVVWFDEHENIQIRQLLDPEAAGALQQIYEAFVADPSKESLKRAFEEIIGSVDPRSGTRRSFFIPADDLHALDSTAGNFTGRMLTRRSEGGLGGYLVNNTATRASDIYIPHLGRLETEGVLSAEVGRQADLTRDFILEALTYTLDAPSRDGASLSQDVTKIVAHGMTNSGVSIVIEPEVIPFL